MSPAASGRSKLDFKRPVPSDIEIAQSITPAPVTDIAAQLGLGDDDYEVCGKYKAKVRSTEIVLRNNERG